MIRRVEEGHQDPCLVFFMIRPVRLALLMLAPVCDVHEGDHRCYLFCLYQVMMPCLRPNMLTWYTVRSGQWVTPNANLQWSRTRGHPWVVALPGAEYSLSSAWHHKSQVHAKNFRQSPRGGQVVTGAGVRQALVR